MGVGDGWDLPQGAEPWSDFHWFQPSTKGDLDLVILSLKPSWYTGHFVGGRMVPCSGSGCEICALGIGGQVRYVFAAAECSTQRVGLIEFGRSNGFLIRDLSDRSGGLRGLHIVVRKHSKNTQSRTEIQYIETTVPTWYLSVKAPDPCLALYLTWNKLGVKMPAAFEANMRELSSIKAPEGLTMTQSEVFREKAKLAKRARSGG